MENEIWKEIPGYKGLYEVSIMGKLSLLKDWKSAEIKQEYEKHVF